MTKTAPGFSLKERPKTFYPAKDEESSETSDFNKTEDVPRNETSGDEGNSERKPWQDRNREGGGDYGERKPWQDRNREGGGGYGERKPWQDRNREGGGGSGGYGERKPWQDRNREGGG
ncbi:MAG TPA: hypothetical protein PLW66_13195, partial [Saprospiraceae bacterium]|nr:hypothetical protein [Saprospiraceae bacterium]